MNKKQKNIRRILALGDQHLPHLDSYTEDLVRKVAKEIHITDVVIAGDLVDWMQMSHFAKNPFVKLTGMADDAQAAHEYLCDWRKILGKSGELVFMAGNHEKRIETWKKFHPEVAAVKGLSIPELFDLKGAGVTQYIPYSPDAWSDINSTPTVYWVGGKLAIMHGVRYSIIAGNVCNMYIRDYGCSGLSFHNHKNAIVSRRLLREDIQWHEAGCMCQLNPEYKANPNWQQGFVIITQEDSVLAPVDISVIPVYNNKATPSQRYCFVDGKKVTRG
jgi:hypothetical protein